MSSPSCQLSLNLRSLPDVDDTLISDYFLQHPKAKREWGLYSLQDLHKLSPNHLNSYDDQPQLSNLLFINYINVLWHNCEHRDHLLVRLFQPVLALPVLGVMAVLVEVLHGLKLDFLVVPCFHILNVRAVLYPSARILFASIFQAYNKRLVGCDSCFLVRQISILVGIS